MIKGVGRGPDGRPVVFLGLSAANVARLMADQLIHLDLAELGLPACTVVILGGHTEADITRRLEADGRLPAGTADRMPVSGDDPRREWQRTWVVDGDHRLLQSRVAELAALYAADFVDPPLAGGPFYTAARFAERLTGQYLPAAGFTAAIALDNTASRVVGFAYGCPLPADTPWWDGAIPPLPDDLTRETGGRTFAILDVLVARGLRRQGIAGQLHAALLKGRAEERVTLLSSPPQQPAYGMWQRWGYRQVGELGVQAGGGAAAGADSNMLHVFLRQLNSAG